MKLSLSCSVQATRNGECSTKSVFIMIKAGADLEIYEWWCCVIIICTRSAHENFKTTPTFTSTLPTLTSTLPTLPRTRSANAHTSHKSQDTTSVLVLLVAQAIRWRYSASVGQAIRCCI